MRIFSVMQDLSQSRRLRVVFLIPMFICALVFFIPELTCRANVQSSYGVVAVFTKQISFQVSIGCFTLSIRLHPLSCHLHNFSSSTSWKWFPRILLSSCSVSISFSLGWLIVIIRQTIALFSPHPFLVSRWWSCGIR